jgi:eukaryotic-like serine/threonine-protein kinase
VDYMSPEQVLGQEVDHRTDLFSLGVVLYQMATGTLPFKGDTSGAIFNAILNQTPPSPVRLNPDLPARLGEIIDKALEKDRALRYQHASDVCTDLKRLKRDTDSGKVAASLAGVSMTKPRVKRLALGIGTGLALIALVAALGFWFLHQGRETAGAPLTPVPLTTYPGEESYPSFSPDGTQVAFQWQQEGQNCHIYIKQVGVEPPFQLTHAAVNDDCPAWSPDGRTIAFIRELEPKKLALMLIPQRGGPERQLETWAEDVSKGGGDPLNGPYLTWTPDSKWLAFPYMEAEQKDQALFLISVETGEKRRLTTPPADGTRDTSPALSPDGGTLAFSRIGGHHTDLYLLRLGEDYKQQGEPKKIDTGSSWNGDVAWTPSGQEIVFSAVNGQIQGLWRMDISKPGKPVSLGLPSENASAPSISRTGKRLAYVVGKRDSNIWRVDLAGPGRKPGKPFQLISSTQAEYRPTYSPDGKRIAFVSEQTGSQEIWICDSDGRNSVQLTSLNANARGQSWSPDGKSIAFDANPEGKAGVYVVSVAGGSARRLTRQLGNFPYWSRDGQSIYFNSPRSGSDQIWKAPAQGGEAIQVTYTKEGADVPQESPDGKFLYYCRGWPFAQSVWRLPVEGGEESKVIDSVHPQTLWTVRQEGIYYFTPPHDKGRSTLCLYEFASGKTRKILEAERPLAGWGNVAISPDGRTILYGQWDEVGSDLMLVENFH